MKDIKQFNFVKTLMTAETYSNTYICIYIYLMCFYKHVVPFVGETKLNYVESIIFVKQNTIAFYKGFFKDFNTQIPLPTFWDININTILRPGKLNKLVKTLNEKKIQILAL